MDRRHTRRIALAAIVFAAAWAADAMAASSPPPGSVERSQIMDALRPDAEVALHGPVKFVVRTLRVSQGWAYASVEPQRPNGRPYRISRPDPMNAYAGALLHRNPAGRWIAVEFILGPTDVWYLNYCSRVPKDLLEGC
jgi:hypothetical protein